MAKPRARFEFDPYALPLVHPLRTAAGNVDVRRGWLVRLFEGDAVVGLGDVAPLRRAGTESYREARELIGQFSKAGGSIETVLNDLGAPGLLPFEQLEPGGWEEALRSALRSLPALRFGIDLALWDRAAKLAGLPLASILNPNAAYNVKANSLVTDDVRSPAALEELGPETRLIFEYHSQVGRGRWGVSCLRMFFRSAEFREPASLPVGAVT